MLGLLLKIIIIINSIKVLCWSANGTMRTKRLNYRKNPLRGENLWVRSVGTASGDRRRRACDPPVQVAVLFGYSLYLCFRLVAMISSSPP